LKIYEKKQALVEEFRALQDVMTPTQMAKYIVFVQENPASVSLLSRVWKIMADNV